LTQVLYLTALLTQLVIEHFGTRPDPCDLADLTKRLHDRHFGADASFNSLRAGAMIRIVCGESHLSGEIPFWPAPT
jgi:hypothetical protein